MEENVEARIHGEQGAVGRVRVVKKRGMEMGFPGAEWRGAVVASARRPRGVKRTAGSVLVFCGKLAALEVLRRGTQARCRLVWWALQGLSVSGAPGLGWLRRWAPFRALADASESFSKPMIFLSLTTVVVSAYNEAREKKTSDVSDKDPGVHLAVVDTGTGEIEEEILVVDKQVATSVAPMREELSKHGVIVPERVADDEVRRFWLASKGDTAKFVTMMRRTLEWRQSYDFVPESELRGWSSLVFWHLRDAHDRPILIIRLGPACNGLTPAQRPQFAQAVISQVEYGIQNLLTMDDPRLTVVMDCQGTTAFGFPVKMLKSCVALVQEHYPMRLASLFVVNAPPLVHAVANAIIQMLRPATREKIRVEGDQYAEVLAKSFGGLDTLPAVLGGTCSCANCVASEEKVSAKVSLMDSLANSEAKQPEYHVEVPKKTMHDVVLSARNPHLPLLRVIILCLVGLWIVIAMLSGRS
ncbi:hypothetical protein M758_1G215400 [Ceratodon purpureus]|nr:hypothetical protein M758_1G215400 [Ceratodon purpureus]